jgi:hypothetical protein
VNFRPVQKIIRDESKEKAAQEIISSIASSTDLANTTSLAPQKGDFYGGSGLDWRSQYSRIIQIAITTATVGVENLLVG